MRVESIRTLSGPNVYSHRPVLLMRLDLEGLYEKESYEVEGFVERLLALMPSLREHHCSKGYAGGFVERLEEGTYFGHIVEHVTLELAAMAGCKATHGKTRYAGEPGLYNVVIEFCAEHATRYLLGRAVALVEAAIKGEEFPLASWSDACRWCARLCSRIMRAKHSWHIRFVAFAAPRRIKCPHQAHTTSVLLASLCSPASLIVDDS